MILLPVKTRIVTFFTLVVLGISFVLTSSKFMLADEPQFNRDVRPILSRNCFACHGPDKKKREGGFRIDLRESAIANADSGLPPIVPSNASKSELVRRIDSKDESEQMPPPDSHKALSQKEKETLRKWINAGARFETHWAFDPPKKQSPPKVHASDWPRNPIDHFILAKLENEKLSPSPEANRETLIRRVTLDLTGLPPTLKEIESFLNDNDEQAYERIVDRLMNTTAYAERRAQDWLDLARFADTRGFADDNQRNIWPYRDWVIRAFNQNMPFDQFTIEQLAGDMLPSATDNQRLATAFHRNAPQAKGMTYPVEEYRIRGVVDRVNTTGKVWLGLTMGCAECHDHKFDPITQHDYYAMFALFNNIEHRGSGFQQGGPTMTYNTLSPNKRTELLAKQKQLDAQIKAAIADLPPTKLKEEKHLLGKWNEPKILTDSKKFNVMGDLTIAAKIKTKQEIANIVSKYDWRGEQRSYVFGIGGEGDKNGVPGHLFAWISAKTHPFSGVEIYGSQKLNDGLKHEVIMSFNAGENVRLFVDGIEDKSARIIGEVPNSIAKSDRRLAIGSGYNGTETANAYQFKGGLSNVRIYEQAIEKIVRLTDEGKQKVARVNTLSNELTKVKYQLKSAIASQVPVMRERFKPRETFIHLRGNFLKKGNKVSPGIPNFLLNIQNQTQPTNRLELARWLVDGKNPLVARVVVNRFWQSYFGGGLVATVDDFGVQGSMPTHRELLDWLACEFVDCGWDMKRIHRLIVTSATYRQANQITRKLKKHDPNNKLLTRMPRLRLPAEQIRDQALSVSGLLVNKVGGPSVFPVHPRDYWQQRALPGTWKESGGTAMHRRTIYTYWRRMALHPSLELLNAPARETCVARRNISNVPTQALVLLNDPIFVEAANTLAARIVEQHDSDVERIKFGFRLVLGRLPDKAELQKFTDFVVRERVDTKNDKAIWELVCSILLNLDETITRP